MSRSQSTRRRLSLLAGSSLVAASVSAAALFAAAAAPSAALAQAVCAPAPTSTSNGGNNVNYAANTTATAYNPGITCSSGGNMTVTTNGAVTVSTTTGGNGVNLTGNGGDSVTWNSTAGTLTGGVNTNGAVLDVTTGSGAITINTGAINASSATNSHAIYADSASGSIGITTFGNVDAVDATAGNTGIYAVTGGAGTVNVTVGSTANTTSGRVQGRQRGIYAETEGTGALTISAHRSVTGSATPASVGIEAVSAGGLLTVNVLGIPTSGTTAIVNGGSAGAGIRTTATTGNAVINIGVRGRAGGAWGVDANVGTGTTTLNVADYTVNTDPDNDGQVSGLRAAGAGTFIANIDGILLGRASFAGLAGGAQVNFGPGGRWLSRGVTGIEFSPGADVLAIGDGGLVILGATGAAGPTHVVAFGDGVDRIENAGVLVIGPLASASGTPGAGPETRITGLERFEHSGVILLGSTVSESNGSGQASAGQIAIFNTPETDGLANDILSLPSTTFVGDGGVIFFDVDLNASQANCTDRDAGGNLAAADCLRIENGATEGVTYARIVDKFPGDRGAYSPGGIVLVDVAGGTSAQGHFLIDPDSQNYNAAFGGVIDKGLFFFPLLYDEAAQQHRLVGLPGGNAMQLPLLAQAAQGVWRTSTGSWFERQAYLRSQPDEVADGVWLRVSAEFADRDLEHSVSAFGNTFDFDNSFSQTTYAVTGGLDLFAGGGGDNAWVAGLLAGYAHGEIDYDASPNTVRIDGWTGGAYASIVSGGFFVDGAITANKAVIDNDMPALNLIPAGTILSTDSLSVGGQVDAGWRLPFGPVFVEPLASLSYVKTEIDDLDIAPDDTARVGAAVEFEDPTSLRAALGVRVSLDQDYGGFRAQYSVLGRVWNEFEDGTGVLIRNLGPDLPVADEFTGQFTEIGVGASVFSLGGAVSGFVNVGGKIGDDYQSIGGSAGVRVTW